jgi:hypothetical protein
VSTLRRSQAATRSSKSNPGPAVDRVVLDLTGFFFFCFEGFFFPRFAIFEAFVMVPTIIATILPDHQFGTDWEIKHFAPQAPNMVGWQDSNRHIPDFISHCDGVTNRKMWKIQDGPN